MENERSALRFLSRILDREAMVTVSMAILDEHTRPEALSALLEPLRQGRDIALLSEAGCPGVADPGAGLVRAAHDQGFQVIPLLGSSAIALAVMASGMNGQAFRFHGYLPRERGARVKALRALERAALERGETQVFIETPYRNTAMLADISRCLRPSTRVCAVWGLGSPFQGVASLPAASLGGLAERIGKAPCTFLIGA